MPTVNIPKYFDVSNSIETATLEISKDSGMGINISTNRYISSREKRIIFSMSCQINIHGLILFAILD